MSSKLFARLLAVVVLQASAASAAPRFLLDPVTTHTNGMQLASADPQRNSTIYEGCDRHHKGCCGGKYNSPMMTSLLRPKRCSQVGCERRPLLDDRTPGLITGIVAPSGNGMEPAKSVRLGPAPNVGVVAQ